MSAVTTLPYTKVAIGEPGTPEWHEIRRTTGVGASECAAVMGLSHWASPLDIYLLKRGLTEPDPPSRAMRRGNAIEPFIASEFEMETGFKGAKPDYMAVSVEYPWMTANTDWIGDCGTMGAELKSSDMSKNWGETGSQDVPEYYYIQVQHQLIVTGLPVIYLVVMLPFSDLRIYPITLNEKIKPSIVETCRVFWENTQNGIAPEGDASPEAVKKLYPVVDADKEIEISDHEAADLVATHHDINSQLKVLEERKNAITARLMFLMGDAKKARIAGWTGSLSRSQTETKMVPAHERKGGIVFRINHPRKKGE